MPLFLLELSASARSRAELEPFFDQIADAVQQAGGEVVEIQVGVDLARVFVVVEHDQQASLAVALRAAGLAIADIAQVRLVGASLESVKAAKGKAQYLVEWDLPKDLAMDAYLARKREKSPLYAQVPEVRFLRTYVREDMVKCLCFYDGPDEAAIRRAREVVSAPVDRLTRLADVDDGRR